MDTDLSQNDLNFIEKPKNKKNSTYFRGTLTGVVQCTGA